MGGEELKTPVFALLFLGAGLFIQTQAISAQQTAPGESSVQGTVAQRAAAQGAVERDGSTPFTDPRAGEANISLGDAAGGQNQTAVSTGSSIWVMIRMVLVLALAAAAVYGVVFFIKRASKPAVASDPFLKILANVSLGSNRYAHIVSVGGKAWLLGSSDGGVNLIGEIDDRDVINAMLLEDSRKNADSQTGRFSDFVSMLRRFGAQTESRAAKADDIRKRRERLKGL